MNPEDEKIINEVLQEVTMTEPKFQWSKMSPDRSEQVVVRGDDELEWKKNIETAKGMLPQSKAFPDDTGPLATPQTHVQAEVELCPIHKKPFREGKFGKFCATKMPDESWCKEKPKK